MIAATQQDPTQDRPSFTVIEGGLAFRAQVEALTPKLLPRAMMLCRNASDAQDLLQDTVERALRFEHQFVPGSNLRAWLHQVLYSVFVTRCRSRGRERRALDRLAVDPVAWTQADPEPSLSSLPPRLANALASLPERFQRTLLLVDLWELPYKDAAALLSVPIGTVMSRLHRARRMLRDVLGDEDLAA